MEDKKALEDHEMEEVTGGNWQKTTQKLFQGALQGVAGCVVDCCSVCNNFCAKGNPGVVPAGVSGAEKCCAVCLHFTLSSGSETTGMCSRCDGSSLHRVVS